MISAYEIKRTHAICEIFTTIKIIIIHMRNLSLVNDSQPAPFWHTQLIYRYYLDIKDEGVRRAFIEFRQFIMKWDNNVDLKICI
jgi:hypothetical protein